MQPTKAWLMISVEHCGKRLSVILVLPATAPQFLVAGSDNSALTTGTHDFILAEGKRVHMTETSNHLSAYECAMRLSAVLYNEQSSSLREIQNPRHIGGPTA